jgi:hypothetical protein
VGAAPASIATLVSKLLPGLTLATMSAGMSAAGMSAAVGVFLRSPFGMEASGGAAAAVGSLTVVSAAKEMEAAGLLRPGRCLSIAAGHWHGWGGCVGPLAEIRLAA